MTIISLLLLASLLPNLTFTAHVNVGIVNGKEVKPHSRPYMVSLQWNGKHICGGFLISDQWVLTAAHCLNRSFQSCPPMTVVVGTLDLSSKILDRITVMRCIPHPESTIKPYRNDIMLLKLYKKVNQNNNVNWISIPEKAGDVASDLFCSVAGWGRMWSGFMSAHLKEAYVFIKNPAECRRGWGSEYIASQMICVYGSGGSCEGDSGGPLVCGKTAVGITSFGDISDCNSPVKHNVYTKISAFLPWIHATIS